MTLTWDMIKRIEIHELHLVDEEYDEKYVDFEARFYLKGTREENIKFLDSTSDYPKIQDRLDYIAGSWRTPENLANPKWVEEFEEEIEEFKLETRMDFDGWGGQYKNGGMYHLEGDYVVHTNSSFHHFFQHMFDWMPNEMKDIIYDYRNSKNRVAVYIEDGMEYPVTCGMIDRGFMYSQKAIDELFQGNIGKYLKEEAAKNV